MFVLAAYDLNNERDDSDRRGLRQSFENSCLGRKAVTKLSESCYSFHIDTSLRELFDDLQQFVDGDDAISVVEIKDMISSNPSVRVLKTGH